MPFGYHRRIIGSLAAVVAAVGIGVGIYVAPGGGGGGGGASWYISPSGSDSNPGTSGAPFQTMDKCYRAAAPGDTCFMQSGTYVDQTIAYTSAKVAGSTCRLAETFGDGTSTSLNTSGCVQFTPAGGATVTTGSIIVSAPYVWLNGLTASTPGGNPNAIEVGEDSAENGSCLPYAGLIHDIIVQSVSNQLLLLHGGSYIYVKGSTFDQSHETVQGTANPQSNVWSGCNDSSANIFQLHNFAIDGDTFSNLIQTCDGTGSCGVTQHLECVHYFDGYNVVIQNTKFLNCAQYDISMADNNLYPTANLSHVLMQNNVFDAPCSHQNLDVADGGPGGPNGYACGSNHQISWQCDEGTLNTINPAVWANTKYSTATLAFVNPGAPNQSLSVTVSGNDITVHLATNGSGVLTSTITDVTTAINASGPASALVTASGSGSGVVGASARTGAPYTSDETWRFNVFATGLGNQTPGADDLEPQIVTDTGLGCLNTAVYGNAGYGATSSFRCGAYASANVVFDYAVSVSSFQCGTHSSINHSAASLFTNEAGYDWTQPAGAASINFLTQATLSGYPIGDVITGFPSTDFFGNPRPAAGGSSNIDAGAYEKAGS